MPTPLPTRDPNPDTLFDEAIAEYGAALARLVRSCEPDHHLRQDLTQEIHLALWRSFARFDGRCSLRTWVYRVAHNTAASHVVKDRSRRRQQLMSLEAMDTLVGDDDTARDAERRILLDELSVLVQQLEPLDRQITLLYLEGLDAASIAEITGISAGNVATKVHRIKRLLADRARRGGHHG